MFQQEKIIDGHTGLKGASNLVTSGGNRFRSLIETGFLGVRSQLFLSLVTEPFTSVKSGQFGSNSNEVKIGVLTLDQT